MTPVSREIVEAALRVLASWVDGRQWSSEDEALLRSLSLPPATPLDQIAREVIQAAIHSETRQALRRGSA